MTKNELEGRIHGVAIAMIYGLYLSQFSEHEKVGGATVESLMLDKMKTTGFFFAPTEQPPEFIFPNQLHAMYSDHASLRAAKQNLSLLMGLSLLRVSFEGALQYAKERDSLAALKKELWFYYTRIVRNVTSHGDHVVLERWDKELRDLRVNEVKWRHRTLSTKDVGTKIIFNQYDAWKLHQDIIDCIQNRLP